MTYLRLPRNILSSDTSILRKMSETLIIACTNGIEALNGLSDGPINGTDSLAMNG